MHLYLGVIIRSVLSALNNVIGKIGVVELNVPHFMIARQFMIYTINLFVYKDLKKDWEVVKNDKKLQKSFFISSFLMMSGGYTFYLALSLAPVSIVSPLVNATNMVMLILLSYLIKKEVRCKSFYVYLTLLVLTVPFITGVNILDLSSNEDFDINALWFLIASSTLYGLEGLRSGDELKKVSANGLMFYRAPIIIIYAFILSMCLGLKIEDTLDKMTIYITSILLLIGVIAFFIQYLHNKGFQKLGVTITSLFGNTVPIFTAVLAYLFLDETVTLIQIIAIIISIIIIIKMPKEVIM